MENNELPERLLAQISEHSGHGFCLFYTNAAGELLVHSYYDSPIIRDGFLKNIEQFVEQCAVMDMEESWNMNPDESDDEEDD